jgi:hypothetical protein
LQAPITMLLWMWFLNVWDNVSMGLKYVSQQYFTCICFLGLIRYNKTFIAWGFRKYENLLSPTKHREWTHVLEKSAQFLLRIFTCRNVLRFLVKQATCIWPVESVFILYLATSDAVKLYNRSQKSCGNKMSL